MENLGHFLLHEKSFTHVQTILFQVKIWQKFTNRRIDGQDSGPHIVSQPHFGISVRVKPTFPKVASWSLAGFPKTQSSSSRVKIFGIQVFFMKLERSWSVDVQNGLAWTIWTFAAQLMGDRKAGSQTGSKSGINLFPTSALRVQHGVGKLSMRATTLVQTSSQSELEVRSYERPKSRESKPGQFRDSTLGVPRKRAI
jgi:hypothetical protein